ncbi:MAG TPA: DUF4956 domain-containing protein [Gemmatimonadales bacterium]|nr:DUF4956 domain-containing protein [Gemmatimonadales bacterium]
MSERRAFGLGLRLVAYYGALAGVAWLVGRALPRWGLYFAERTPGAAAVAMLGGLALICPVAWLYMRTKPKVRYDASLVQTVIVLPVVISGVVLIVRDSVALAFSLAGIVAAVRFRNTLRDTKDAVYIFLAIAVGLAAGVQSFSVAFVVTVIFLGVVLVLWRFDVGAEPPAESFRGRLVVEATWAPGLETAVAGILERYTRRWKLVRTEPTALTFTVQLRREGTPDGLVAAVREEPSKQVTGARFEPLLP